MKKIICLFSIILLIGITANAQDKYLAQADYDFNRGSYQEALTGYKKVYTEYSDPNWIKKNKVKGAGQVRAHVIFKIAECYRMQNFVKQESQWYAMALTVCHGADSLNADKYYTASLHYLDSVSTLNQKGIATYRLSATQSSSTPRDTSAPVNHGIRLIPHTIQDTVRDTAAHK